MKNKTGIVILAIAVFGLFLILKERWDVQYSDKVEVVEYAAVLYYGRIRAVDSETSATLAFDVSFDYELITPYVKGSSPAVIDSHDDLTKTVAIVGNELEHGLPMEIKAEGYTRGSITLESQSSGLGITGTNRVIEIRLRKSR